MPIWNMIMKIYTASRRILQFLSQLGNKNEVVELIFPILKTCIDKEYLEPSRDIYDSEKKKKKKKVEVSFF